MNLGAVSGPTRRHRTPHELAGRFGRALLWVAVALVLLRGVSGMLASRPAPPFSRVANAAAVWPDDAARAFAAEFAIAYLQQPPPNAASPAGSGLTEFATPELADQLTRQRDGQGRPVIVRSAIPEQAVRLDGRHALITVAALVDGTPPRTLRLTAPVARDRRGGLAVYDLPSLAAAPERAAVAAPVGDTLAAGDESAAISDVLSRFLRAYVAGDRAGLSYLVPPGTHVGAVAGGFELLDVRSVTAVGPAAGRVRRVLVAVDVRDRVSWAVMGLRYRVRLVRRDRWYVAELNTAGSGTQ